MLDFALEHVEERPVCHRGRHDPTGDEHDRRSCVCYVFFLFHVEGAYYPAE